MPARAYCRANAAGCAYFPAITRTGGGMMKVRENIRISCAFFYYLYPNALSISGNVVVFPHTTLTTSGRECRHINDFLPRLHLLPLPPGMTTSTSAPPARRSGGISTCTHIQKSAPPSNTFDFSKTKMHLIRDVPSRLRHPRSQYLKRAQRGNGRRASFATAHMTRGGVRASRSFWEGGMQGETFCRPRVHGIINHRRESPAQRES